MWGFGGNDDCHVDKRHLAVLLGKLHRTTLASNNMSKLTFAVSHDADRWALKAPLIFSLVLRKNSDNAKSTRAAKQLWTFQTFWGYFLTLKHPRVKVTSDMTPEFLLFLNAILSVYN